MLLAQVISRPDAAVAAFSCDAKFLRFFASEPEPNTAS